MSEKMLGGAEPENIPPADAIAQILTTLRDDDKKMEQLIAKIKEKQK